VKRAGFLGDGVRPSRFWLCDNQPMEANIDWGKHSVIATYVIGVPSLGTMWWFGLKQTALVDSGHTDTQPASHAATSDPGGVSFELF